MKKIILSLLCGVLMCSFVMPVLAQELTQRRKTAVFSPAVMAGSATQAKGQQVKKTLPKTARTTILRFEPGQIELSDVQKELLLHVAERLKKMTDGRVSVVSASKNNRDALSRIDKVEKFLTAYAGGSFLFYIRIIQPEYVVPSVNNTVKITINR